MHAYGLDERTVASWRLYRDTSPQKAIILYTHRHRDGDIAKGWTECLPLLHHGQDAVLLALDRASQLLPFPLLGLDTDNGVSSSRPHYWPIASGNMSPSPADAPIGATSSALSSKRRIILAFETSCAASPPLRMRTRSQKSIKCKDDPLSL